MFVLWSSPNYTPIRYTCPIKKINQITLAHLMWRMLSPILLQLEDLSSSVYSFTLAGSPLVSIKRNAGYEATALNSTKSDRQSARIPNFLHLHLPLAAKTIKRLPNSPFLSL